MKLPHNITQSVTLLLCVFVCAVSAVDTLFAGARCSYEPWAVCGIGRAQRWCLHSYHHNGNCVPRFPRKDRRSTSYVEAPMVCVWSCRPLSLLLCRPVRNKTTAWTSLFSSHRGCLCRPHGTGTQSNPATNVLRKDEQPCHLLSGTKCWSNAHMGRCHIYRCRGLPRVCMTFVTFLSLSFPLICIITNYVNDCFFSRIVMSDLLLNRQQANSCYFMIKFCDFAITCIRLQRSDNVSLKLSYSLS